MDQNEPPKPWEKSWTPDDLRRNSTCWTLAGDAGLLKHLQEFSQNLVAKTHSTQKALDKLVEDLNTTSSAVNNITNSFLSLANTQFVENRVDDDEEEMKVTAESTVPLQKTPSKTEIETETVDMVREALTVGMSIMDTMFETVEVPAVSDSEEDESSASMGRVILRPVNPYANRPLPFLIGSHEFYEDDRVGLADMFSDEEESGVPGATEVPSSESASDVEADYAISDRIKRLRIPSVSGSENSEPESEQLPTSRHSKQQCVAPLPSNTFGEESSHEAANEQLPTGVDRLPNNFAAELAARLGVVPEPEQQTAPQKVPPLQEQQKVLGNMFLPPLEDDDDNDDDDDNEDDVLFGKNAKYSTGGDLFDDLGDWNKKSSEPESLWDEPESKRNEANKEPDLKPSIKEEQEAAFGQNREDDLFGNDLEDDLFSSKVVPKVKKPSVASVPTGSQKSQPVVNHQNVQPKVDKSAPPLSETSGLFDDLWDTSDSDYNSTVNTEQSTAPKEDGLFVSDDEKKVVKDSDIPNESIVQAPPVKKPVGGVSVLGNMNITASQLISRLPSAVKESGNNDTVARKITENEPKASHNIHPKERADSPVNTQSASKVIQQKKLQSLFDDDNDSDEDNLLFSSASSTGSRSRRSIDVLSSDKKIECSSEEPLQKASLFGSDLLIPPPDDANDDDLFNVKTSGLTLGAGDARNSSVSRENLPAGGLFDDWEDDILSTESKKDNSPAPALIPVEPSDNKGMAKEINNISKTDNHSKASSLFDKQSNNTPIFSGDVNDNFVISGNTSETDIFSETGKPCVTQRQNSKVNLFYGVDFDEDVNIFGENPGSEISENAAIEEVTSLTNKERDPVLVTTEPPIFPTNPDENIFPNPVGSILSKDVSVVKDTPEIHNTENTEVASVTPRNIYESNKPVVSKKPVVPLGKPPTATQPSENVVESYVSEISALSAACVDQLSTDVKGMHNEKIQDEIRKEPVVGELYPNDSDKKQEVIAPVTKPKPPKTLDIRKTTTLQQDSSTGEDTFGDSSPGVSEDSFHISQKTEHISSTAFGELLKGYSPPEDKTDGSAFSREKLLTETKREPANKAVTSPKSGEKLPGKIQCPSLNIDPLALLPGAKPPRKGFQSEEAIGFDQPAADITALLHSAGKERVKIQVKRRPQSRQARQEALRASTIISQNEMAVEAVPSPTPRSQQPDRNDNQTSSAEPKSKNLEADQNEGSMKVPTVPNPPATGSSLLSPSTDEEDLFGVPSDLPSDYSDGNDLFRVAPILSPTEVPKFSQKANLPVEPVISSSFQSSNVYEPSIFTSSSGEREESFFPTPVSQSISEKQSFADNHDAYSKIMQSTVVETAENDLFQVVGGETSSNSLFPSVQKETAPEKDVSKSMKINKLDDLFSNVEEDLFPSAKSDNYSSAPQADLFGNDNVPALPSDGGLFSSSLWTSETKGNMPSTVKFTENHEKDQQHTQLGRESDLNNYPQHDNVVISSEKISSEKNMDPVPKIAAGGLSVLNDDENDRLFSDNCKTDARTSHKHSNGKEKNIKIRTGENSSLFGDDSPETDDLFSSISHSLEKRTASSKTDVSVTESKGGATKQVLSKGSKSLFDDDEEEDLFGRITAKPNVSSSSWVLSSVDALGKDELFSARSVVPNKPQRTAVEASSGKKKEATVVFDDPLMAFSKPGDTSP